jgi:tetratricopeptide (TPR) repeat protein
MPRLLRFLLVALLVVSVAAGLAWWLRPAPATTAQGDRLLDRGDYPAAAAAYREQIIRDAGNAAAYAGLGNAWLLQGETERAVQALESAVALQPDRPHIYCQLADAYVQVRARAQAVAALEESLKRDPDCAHAHLVAGEQSLRDDDLTRALAEFRTAIKLAPDLAPAYQRAGYVLIELGRRAEAEQVLTAGLAKAPHRPDLHLQLGRLYFDRPNDPVAQTKAEAHYRQALTGVPDQAAIRAALGTLERRRGNDPAAQRWWESALRINRNQAEALFGLAELVRKAGDTDRADILFRRYREVQAFRDEMGRLRTQAAVRRDKPLRLRLATLALDAGITEEAERQVTALLAEHPDDPRVRRLQGELYLSQGRTQEARLEFELASRLRPVPGS